jgi:hypothetical protein
MCFGAAACDPGRTIKNFKVNIKPWPAGQGYFLFASYARIPAAYNGRHGASYGPIAQKQNE